jgi:hypothetical protein
MENITKKDTQKLNAVYHRVLDRYLDSVVKDNSLIDPRMLSLVEAYLKRNGTTAIEEDVEAMEAKRKAVAEARGRQNKKRETSDTPEFFDILNERKKRLG